MTFNKGDRVQFFGSVPLPEGGFPYRGDADIIEAGENDQVIVSNVPSSVEPGDYMCLAPSPYAGLSRS